MYKLYSSTKMDAKKKTKANKLAIFLLAAGLAVAGVNTGLRIIARNAMSHAGFREQDFSRSLTNPLTYLTRGEYKGFRNWNLDSSDDPFKRDLIVYEPDPFDKLPKRLHNMDLNAVYLGLQKNPLPFSRYQPTRLTGSDKITFYSIKDFIPDPGRLIGNRIVGGTALERILGMKEGDALSMKDIFRTSMAPTFTNVDLGNYTLSFGRDKSGIYTSIYDVWDFVPDSGHFKNFNSGLERLGSKILPKIGTPIHFYDRFYWKDYGFDENKQGDIQNGN